jgi:hypothetical protein
MEEKTDDTIYKGCVPGIMAFPVGILYQVCRAKMVAPGAT